ncbi:MAG: polyprenyl synthetase family protein [Desulfobacterales bacterium]
MSVDSDRPTPIDRMETIPIVKDLLLELASGLELYWDTAGRILNACGVTLAPLSEDAFSLRKNFFSFLFLYSFRQGGIPHGRRMLYAATLQCLRGMVTGCDNLLDDEYKATLETDIPADGHRFRSVVDIMVSDRVLFEILLAAARRQEISQKLVSAAATASMKTMIRSGIEEAAEEAGITAILEPEAVLRSIHHLKTGLLFQCPWDIPLTIETLSQKQVNPFLEALYRIGIGCQIMDDMVDMTSDIKSRRHNYLVSLVHHGPSKAEKGRLADAMASRPGSQDCEAMGVTCFPKALLQAIQRSHRLLAEGLGTLFGREHQLLVDPAIRFLEQRIGVAHLADGTDP